MPAHRTGSTTIKPSFYIMVITVDGPRDGHFLGSAQATGADFPGFLGSPRERRTEYTNWTLSRKHWLGNGLLTDRIESSLASLPVGQSGIEFACLFASWPFFLVYCILTFDTLVIYRPALVLMNSRFFQYYPIFTHATEAVAERRQQLTADKQGGSSYCWTVCLCALVRTVALYEHFLSIQLEPRCLPLFSYVVAILTHPQKSWD